MSSGVYVYEEGSRCRRGGVSICMCTHVGKVMKRGEILPEIHSSLRNLGCEISLSIHDFCYILLHTASFARVQRTWNGVPAAIITLGLVLSYCTTSPHPTRHDGRIENQFLYDKSRDPTELCWSQGIQNTLHIHSLVENDGVMASPEVFKDPVDAL